MATALMTLAEAKTHLRIPVANTDDDSAIQNIFIPAIEDVIRAECGDIIPASYDENYDGGNYAIWTRHSPILEVSVVQEGWGFTNYELDYVQVNSAPSASMFAYSIDQPSEGKISRRTAGNVAIPFMAGENNIRVVYTAGRQQVPGAVKLAALELLAHWWQGSQQRSAQYESAGFDATDISQPTSGPAGGVIGINVGIPYRVLELLRPFRHLPFIG